MGMAPSLPLDWGAAASHEVSSGGMSVVFVATVRCVHEGREREGFRTVNLKAQVSGLQETSHHFEVGHSCVVPGFLRVTDAAVWLDLHQQSTAAPASAGCPWLLLFSPLQGGCGKLPPHGDDETLLLLLVPLLVPSRWTVLPVGVQSSPSSLYSNLFRSRRPDWQCCLRVIGSLMVEAFCDHEWRDLRALSETPPGRR